MWEWVQFPNTFPGHSINEICVYPHSQDTTLMEWGLGMRPVLPYYKHTVMHLQTWFTHRIKQLTTYIAMVTSPTHLFLPYLKAVDVDVILNVLKQASESIHMLRECLQLGFKLTGLYKEVLDWFTEIYCVWTLRIQTRIQTFTEILNTHHAHIWPLLWGWTIEDQSVVNHCCNLFD